MNTLTFRLAREDDAPALLGIYSQYIDTSITFEDVLPSEEEFRARIRDISSFYPYIVCERDGAPIAYAYAHRQFERAAYRWVAELSVYLSADARGHRLGETMYDKVIALLKMQDVQTVNAIVTSPNPRSERLHERMGFEKTGFFPNVGYKNGEWHATTWYTRCIGDYAVPPRECVCIHDLSAERVSAVLNDKE